MKRNIKTRLNEWDIARSFVANGFFPGYYVFNMKVFHPTNENEKESFMKALYEEKH